jgi:hypothetical protein
MGLLDGLQSAIGETKTFIGNNPLATIGGAAAGGALVGATVTAIATRKKRSRKSSVKKRPKARKRTTTRSKPKRRKYKYARTAGKRKDTSTKRIRMTKNGQPYVILKSGKARFIKKSSARASRKRKGGRY